MRKDGFFKGLPVFLLFSIGFFARGDGPQLIGDLYEPVVSAGGVGSFTAAGGLTFMTGTSVEEGPELWISDGTSEGTTLLKDIFPGIEGSAPTDLVAMNGLCFFTAQDGVHGRELWKSDGTAAGTVLVKDIYPGSASSNPDWLNVMDGVLYFMAGDGIQGRELWRSDGSSEGTRLVKDLNPSGDGAFDYYFAEMNGKLYFCARDAAGVGLFATDGTEAGTEKIMEGACSFLTSAGDRLFFSCNGELYWSDGTAAGSGLLMDINPSGSSYPRFFTPVGDLVFFRAEDAYGCELWKVDPLTGQAAMVKNIAPSSGSSYPENLVDIQGTLYFGAKTSTYGTYRLWKSDGTAAGTVAVSAAGDCYSPSGITWFQDRIYFIAGHLVYGYELFCYDEVGGTLEVLSDVMPDNPQTPYGIGTYSLTRSNDKLFFRVSHTFTTEKTLYSSDGTQEGTKAIGTFWQSINGSSYPYGFTEFEGMVYFHAKTKDFGCELWKTNCAEITEMVKDIGPGNADGIVSNRVPFYPFDDFMLFRANDGSGSSLWKTDGTEAGTVRVHSVDPLLHSTPLPYSPQDFITFADAIYFLGSDAASGFMLWKTDGTAAGTSGICPVTRGAELVKSGDALYFCNMDSSSGSELWKSDGTPGGTEIVKDIRPGTGGSSPGNLFPLGDKVLFLASASLQQYKVWVTDGREAGTFVLKDFRPGESFEGYFIGAYQDELYLIVNDGVHAVGLWKTDGTPEGTVKVKGIDINPSGIFYSPVLVYRDRLYFSCRDSVHGVELWGTDGTEAGTYILKDIAPGPADIDVKALAIVNDLLFLDLAVGGQGQPWISDGTEGGTVPLSDWEGVSTLGHFKTQPLYLSVIRNTLLFAAVHSIYGVEPFFYRMDRGDTNLDGSINLFDFRVLAEHWLSGSSISNYWGQYSDITDFGQVDLADLAALCENWAF